MVGSANRLGPPAERSGCGEHGPTHDREVYQSHAVYGKLLGLALGGVGARGTRVASSEYSWTVGHHRDAVLPVRGKRPVRGDDRPAVLANAHVVATEREHRLDG